MAVLESAEPTTKDFTTEADRDVSAQDDPELAPEDQPTRLDPMTDRDGVPLVRGDIVRTPFGRARVLRWARGRGFIRCLFRDQDHGGQITICPIHRLMMRKVVV